MFHKHRTVCLQHLQHIKVDGEKIDIKHLNQSLMHPASQLWILRGEGGGGAYKLVGRIVTCNCALGYLLPS